VVVCIGGLWVFGVGLGGGGVSCYLFFWFRASSMVI
jgi:hypothetical protein